MLFEDNIDPGESKHLSTFSARLVRKQKHGVPLRVNWHDGRNIYNVSHRSTVGLPCVRNLQLHRYIAHILGVVKRFPHCRRCCCRRCEQINQAVRSPEKSTFLTQRCRHNFSRIWMMGVGGGSMVGVCGGSMMGVGGVDDGRWGGVDDGRWGSMVGVGGVDGGRWGGVDDGR